MDADRRAVHGERLEPRSDAGEPAWLREARARDRSFPADLPEHWSGPTDRRRLLERLDNVALDAAISERANSTTLDPAARDAGDA
jgi:hypothetical protein